MVNGRNIRGVHNKNEKRLLKRQGARKNSVVKHKPKVVKKVAKRKTVKKIDELAKLCSHNICDKQESRKVTIGIVQETMPQEAAMCECGKLLKAHEFACGMCSKCRREYERISGFNE